MMTLHLNANIQSHATGGRNVGHESMKVAACLQADKCLAGNQIGKGTILGTCLWVLRRHDQDQALAPEANRLNADWHSTQRGNANIRLTGKQRARNFPAGPFFNSKL